MEPSTMITTIAAYLGSRLAKEKSITNFISEFTGATVDWIKPLFLKEDGTEKDIIKELKANPESKGRKKAIETAFEISLEDNPASEKFIKEIYEQISKTEEGGKIVSNVINSENVNTASVNTGGGDFHIGNNAK